MNTNTETKNNTNETKGLERPKFYLKVLNGYDMAFGIKVFLDHNRKQELFARFTEGNSDNRKYLFKQFVINENLGLLDFTFDIYHEERSIQIIGMEDCRNWIWELNAFRNKIYSPQNEGNLPMGGRIITRADLEK